MERTPSATSPTLITDAAPKPEPFRALAEIALVLGVPVYSVRRAAARGDFRTYKVGAGRTRARLSEVLAAIDRSAGGAQ